MIAEKVCRNIIFLIIIFLISACSTSYPQYTYLDFNERLNLLPVAEQYIGMPYEWGGQSFPGEANASVDCSGFVINVYKQVLEDSDKKLLFEDSTVREIYLRYSDDVTDPQIGDLLFISDGQSDIPSHIGILISIDSDVIKFIDASSLPSIMQVSIREYNVNNPKIHSIKRMRLMFV